MTTEKQQKALQILNDVSWDFYEVAPIMKEDFFKKAQAHATKWITTAEESCVEVTPYVQTSPHLFGASSLKIVLSPEEGNPQSSEGKYLANFITPFLSYYLVLRDFLIQQLLGHQRESVLPPLTLQPFKFLILSSEERKKFLAHTLKSPCDPEIFKPNKVDVKKMPSWIFLNKRSMDSVLSSFMASNPLLFQNGAFLIRMILLQGFLLIGDLNTNYNLFLNRLSAESIGISEMKKWKDVQCIRVTVGTTVIRYPSWFYLVLLDFRYASVENYHDDEFEKARTVGIKQEFPKDTNRDLWNFGCIILDLLFGTQWGHSRILAQRVGFLKDPSDEVKRTIEQQLGTGGLEFLQHMMLQKWDKSTFSSLCESKWIATNFPAQIKEFDQLYKKKFGSAISLSLKPWKPSGVRDPKLLNQIQAATVLATAVTSPKTKKLEPL